MDRFQYLLLLAGCLAITLPLEFVFAARVWRRFRTVLAALLPVVLVYSLWDLLGIWRGHWGYSARFVSGWYVPGLPMPVEELAFFLVIPICGLLSYEAVGTCLRWLRDRRGGARA